MDIFFRYNRKNIALGDDKINMIKLEIACKTANIYDYIVSLPYNFKTKIGDEGNGLSQGQKQRMLIARAIYKNPDYIFWMKLLMPLMQIMKKKLSKT